MHSTAIPTGRYQVQYKAPETGRWRYALKVPAHTEDEALRAAACITVRYGVYTRIKLVQ